MFSEAIHSHGNSYQLIQTYLIVAVTQVMVKHLVISLHLWVHMYVRMYFTM